MFAPDHNISHDEMSAGLHVVKNMAAIINNSANNTHKNNKDLQPGGGYQLPAEAYFDEGWLDREKRELFPANWNFICTESDISEPGSYLATEVGHYPIIVLRDEAGELRAFHNICRHRGARLLEDTGNCSRIVCPYHRWQYGLDGSLQNAPQADKELPDMNKADWGLMPVPVESWMGMVLVNPDGKAGSLEDWLGDLKGYMDVFRVDQLTELAQGEYTFNANWKFYIENHIDWYHLWYTHAQTLGSLDHHKGYYHQLGSHWVSYEPFKDPERADPFKSLEWLDDEARLNGAHLMFPNLALFSGSSWFGIGHLVPDAPDLTRMQYRFFALDGQDPTLFLEGFKQVTQVEDAEMAARLQSTVRSPAFNVGPLTQNYEKPITEFHDNYLKYVSIPTRT